MSIQVKLQQDSITPKIEAAIKAGKDPTPILRAMGTTFLSLTIGTFSSHGAKYRAKAWAPKRDGQPSNLKKKGDLSKAFHLEVTNRLATVSNPKKYARIHQFGGVILPKNKKALRFFSGGRWWTVKKVKMPARPFFPVEGNALTPAAEQKVVAAGLRAARRVMGLK